MKNIITTLILTLAFTALFAQGSDDACLFSQTYYQGTAKALGMGNALGAVGGDMTAININPAGMGLYRSSEFTTSLGLTDNFQASVYYGSPNTANRLRINISNVGYVHARQRSNYRKLRFTQFGIGLTRTNDFNLNSFAKGLNPTSSMIDNYLSRIDGVAVSDLSNYFPYDIYPAWQTLLIDTYQGESGLYYSSPVPQGGIWQSQRKQFKGRSEEWTFAGSANFDERLFFGVSINLAHIKRTGTKTLVESHPDGADPSTGFNQWSFDEDISTTGWGGNAKIGFIWHANPWLRLGGAFHSPTIYAMDESWHTQTESEISWVTRKYISAESHYEYNFVKPLKWVGSVAVVIGQRGLVSLDAECTNFGAARFQTSSNDDYYDYGPTNNEIKATYGRTFNFRLGSEWSLGGSYVRFGGAYYGSPFGLGKGVGSVIKASLGFSLPVSNISTFDFAYELTHGRSKAYLYDAGDLDIEPITHKQFRNCLAATFKMRF